MLHFPYRTYFNFVVFKVRGLRANMFADNDGFRIGRNGLRVRSFHISDITQLN